MHRTALARWRQRLSWGVEIADYPTAPMETDECGDYFAGRRCHAAVQPQWDGHAGWPRCRELASFGDWRWIGRQHLACRQKQFARFRRGQRPVGRASGQPHHFENALGIAIERHRGLLVEKIDLVILETGRRRAPDHPRG